MLWLKQGVVLLMMMKTERKKQHGRHRRKWEDNIKINPKK
jgi:hypothetical protein